jgi:hypothetical protein
VKEKEKALILLKRFEDSEASLNEMIKAWPPGCKYEKKNESRIGPNGQAQYRTCRRVYGCDDPDYNHDWICEDWQDY